MISSYSEDFWEYLYIIHQDCSTRKCIITKDRTLKHSLGILQFLSSGIDICNWKCMWIASFSALNVNFNARILKAAQRASMFKEHWGNFMVSYKPIVEGMFAKAVLTLVSNSANSCVNEFSAWGWNISVSLSRLKDGQASTSISHGRFLELVVKESGSFRKYWPEIQ